ncbi:hypothetical protein OPIT5_01365 [Opitutaceae bacterium TAV5]|nr:hypothetical protein OPIT5_01365 [Opitutaceae bacterium TAV5]
MKSPSASLLHLNIAGLRVDAGRQRTHPTSALR